MGPPEDLVLRPSVKPMRGVLLACCVFVVLGVCMVDESPFVGWLSIGFFGLYPVVVLVMLLPGSFSLRLSRTGFTVRKFFWPVHYSWDDVTPFDVFEVSGNRMVVFNFTGVYKPGAWGRFSQAATGYAAGLPCNFGGLTAEELADLMNDWKRWCETDGATAAREGRLAVAEVRFEEHRRGPRRPRPQRPT